MHKKRVIFYLPATEEVIDITQSMCYTIANVTEL